MEIKEIEKEYKVKFNVNPNMKLETYLKRKGLKSMAKAFKKISILNN